MENSDIISGKMLNEFLASLVVGSGILIGALLARMAKEEVKLGLKYFILLKNILFSAVILTTIFYYTRVNIMIALATPLLFSALFINKLQPVAVYTAFAIVCILSSADSSLYLLVSSLIFLAGFPVGTIAYSAAKKNALIEVLAAYLVFIVIILIKTLIF